MALNMRTPAMALLATLAVAGFQHRDQLGRMLSETLDKTRSTNPDGSMNAIGSGLGGNGGIDGLLGGLGDLLGNAGSTGAMLRDGLDGLLDRFRETGHGDEADSWVKEGPNRDVDPASLEAALGPDVIAQLQTQTGLDRDELLRRLSSNLPKTVDGLTPDGRLPTADEANAYATYQV